MNNQNKQEKILVIYLIWHVNAHLEKRRKVEDSGKTFFGEYCLKKEEKWRILFWLLKSILT
jgi:hypothetical protein